MSIRPVKSVAGTRPTIEGAGVHLHRVFGFGDTSQSDPFLLMADSLGNSGSLGPGSVQWMTAGSGILHQEMPKGDAAGHMHGFQLWANLPASLKMTSPRYQDVAGSEIPEYIDDDGTAVRVITGDWRGNRGPVDGIAADPQYLDVSV